MWEQWYYKAEHIIKENNSLSKYINFNSLCTGKALLEIGLFIQTSKCEGRTGALHLWKDISWVTYIGRDGGCTLKNTGVDTTDKKQLWDPPPSCFNLLGLQLAYRPGLRERCFAE